MLISDRLAYDIAQILELVMTKNKFDENKLTLYLLLLLGRSSSTRGRQHPEYYEVDENTDNLNDNIGNKDNSTIFPLKNSLPSIPAFQYSNPYINGLLFCDYNTHDSQFEKCFLPGYGVLEIHEEASRYVTDVLLLRSLELAKANGIKPTNLHLLLQRMCQLTLSEGLWQQAFIKRCKQTVKYSVAWFMVVANRLEQIQKRKKNSAINETAKNQREQSGSYWLVAGECNAEVVEEISLLDVLKIVPLALKQNFSKDKEFLRLLRSIVSSLNIRYRWLRSCGLTPEMWLNQKQPSINELKQLSQLRENAANSVDWKSSNYEQAYEKEFFLLKADAKSIGGFEMFSDWLNSDIGRSMLSRNQYLTISFGDLSENSEGNIEVNVEFANIPEDKLTNELYEAILQDAGDRLSQDPVLKAFFQQVLLEHRNVVDKDGLLEDPVFKKIVSSHVAYAGLDTEELAEKLFFKTRSLIFEVLQETTETPISEALNIYIQQVLIEQRPAKWLLNKKSFKTRLANDDSLKTLTPEEIHKKAMDYLAKLLSQSHSADNQ